MHTLAGVGRSRPGWRRAAAAAAGAVLLGAGAARAQSAPVVNRVPGGTEPPEVELPLYDPVAGRLAPPSGEWDPTPEVLLWRIRELHSTLEYAAALPVAEQLVLAAPDHPASHYNLACTLARLRRVDAALNALHKAIDAGWRGVEHTTIDPDLRPLHDHPRFAQILQEMARLRRLEQVSPSPLRSGPLDAIHQDLRQNGPALLRRHHVPGAVVAVVHGAELSVLALGTADRGRGAPMTETSRFAVRTPLQLLALMASLREQHAGRLDVMQLVRYGLETQPARGALAARGGDTQLAFLVRGGPRSGPAPAAAAPSPGHDHRIFDLLQAAIEITADQSFRAYCREHFLDPVGAASTELRPPAVHEPEPAMVVGHSGFGTPLPRRSDGSDQGTVAVTTAADLARLLAALCGAGEARRSLASVAAGIETLGEAGGALGLSITAIPTVHGPRLEMSGEHDGQGCLLRWYPEHGVGAVVLYNAAGGREAALQLAALGLGGV